MNLSGKTFVVMGVANKRSIAWELLGHSTMQGQD